MTALLLFALFSKEKSRESDAQARATRQVSQLRLSCASDGDLFCASHRESDLASGTRIRHQRTSQSRLLLLVDQGPERLGQAGWQVPQGHSNP
jgi:hypothetical protein